MTRARLESRRLAGVGVLAIAVLALAVGAGLGRPLIVGVASAPPVDPPPQAGDCLYAGPDGPWNTARFDGSWQDMAYHRWYGPCREPWFGEVVGVRTQADMQTDLAESRVGPGFDPCAALTAAYLGVQRVEPVDGWVPITISASTLEPNRRQYSSGPMWQACVLGAPWWTPQGEPYTVEGAANSGPRTTEPLRGRWVDVSVRNTFGVCEQGSWTERNGVFCGAPHDREFMAQTTWDSATDLMTLERGCRQQIARVMGQPDPSGPDELAAEVVTYDEMGQLAALTDSTVLGEFGSAECYVRPADPSRQLTATVMGLGEGPVPLTPR